MEIRKKIKDDFILNKKNNRSFSQIKNSDNNNNIININNNNIIYNNNKNYAKYNSMQLDIIDNYREDFNSNKEKYFIEKENIKFNTNENTNLNINIPINNIIQKQNQTQNQNEFRGKIEDYKFIKEVGKGSYAIVKSAIHISTGYKYAIKIYEKYKLMDPAKKSAVKREIQILKNPVPHKKM